MAVSPCRLCDRHLRGSTSSYDLGTLWGQVGCSLVGGDVEGVRVGEEDVHFVMYGRALQCVLYVMGVVGGDGDAGPVLFSSLCFSEVSLPWRV